MNKMLKLRKNRNRYHKVRKVKANDSAYNALFDYAVNKVVTSKYTVWSFLPKNLFEQFHRVANIYFAFLLLLQLLPWVSSLTYITTILPLMFVLLVTAVKDLFDDLQRHKSDGLVNKSITTVLRNGVLKEEFWKGLRVGDIICLHKDQPVPADTLLLSTSDPGGSCYVETSQLDGETNLKYKRSVAELDSIGDDLELISTFDGEIECESPNNRLNSFKGVLRWQQLVVPLDNSNLLLRGCTLRNTTSCFALVIYAGAESKLMQNFGERFLKRTNIDRLLNWLVLGIIFLLIFLCLVCAIGSAIWEAKIGFYFQIFLPWESFVPGSTLLRPEERGGEVERVIGAHVIAGLHFLSYIIIFNTLVPISLYVSVELIRFSHSWMINWDLQMCDRRQDDKRAYARARTSTLNEGLGQISHLFTDKTGTLTQNVMKFYMCSINGEVYQVREEIDSKESIPGDTEESSGAVWTGDRARFRRSSVALRTASTRQVLVDKIRSGDKHVHRFFKLLAICHTAIPEQSQQDSDITYAVQSPDEGALLASTRSFGFVLTSWRSNREVTSELTDLNGRRSITLQVLGRREEYELLATLDFNFSRKRMSVVVRDGEGQIILYCKGADIVIRERLRERFSDTVEATDKHLHEFSENGLRTLYCAYRIITKTQFEDWNRRYVEAMLAMESRDELVLELYEELESDLELVGCTAIEDKLQDGVPGTISRLLNAGIKIWMLTGDKQETAVNIACSSGLIAEQTIQTFHIQGRGVQEVRLELERARSEILKSVQTGQVYLEDVDVVPWSELRMTGCWPLPSCGMDTEVDSCYAMVIGGASLVYGLSQGTERLLLEVACMCRAVVVSRVTPIQKSQVVQLAKTHLSKVTLAIGDGANDVSMIRTAHIGVGISGKEGMQATLASDFSIAQFRFLERLLLVHGRWSYVRMSKFARYFFYKNFVFTLCQLYYASFTGFSAQTLYDPTFILFYNLMFTSLPVLVLAIFDQDVTAGISLRYPKLYRPGMCDQLFNRAVFLYCLLEGALTAAVIFFVPCATMWSALNWDGSPLADLKLFGTVVATILIVVVTLRCAVEMSYWTAFNHVTIWGSIIYYIVFMIVIYSGSFFQSYMHTMTHTLETAAFWLLLLLVLIIVIVPVIVHKFWLTLMRPDLVTKLMLRSKMNPTLRLQTD